MEQPYGPPNNSSYNLGLWSMICGIASCVCCCCGSPLGIVAVVLGILCINAENRAQYVERSAKTFAIVGIALGGLSCAGAIVSIIMNAMGAGMHYSPFYHRSPFRIPGMPPV
jgi:hypothetical protein